MKADIIMKPVSSEHTFSCSRHSDPDSMDISGCSGIENNTTWIVLAINSFLAKVTTVVGRSNEAESL